MNLRHALATAGTVLLLASLTGCGNSEADTVTTTGDAAAAAPEDAAGDDPDAAGGGPDAPPGNDRGEGRGASGLIAAVNGSTLQVQNKTAGQVAVTFTDTTTVTEQVAADLAAITVGACVMVTSADATDDTDGAATVSADSIRILGSSEDGCQGPGGAGERGGPGGGAGPDGTAGGGPQSGELPEGAPSDLPSAGAGGRPGGGPGGDSGRPGGTFGEVTATEGGGFTVTAARFGAGQEDGKSTSSEVRVSVDAETDITTTATADTTALVEGRCVAAIGEADDTGAVAATSLSVSDAVDGVCSSGFGPGFGGGRSAADRGESKQS